MTSEQTTKTSALDWVLRVLGAIGLGASALLLWEYTRATLTFCRSGEGCDLVRLSPWASLLGVPTPVYGVVFFSLVLVLAVAPGARARRLLTVAGAVGGLAGVGFILLQAIQIGAFCVYCMTVDVASVAIALIVLARREPVVSLGRASWAAFSAVLLVGFGAPFAYGVATHPAPKGPAVTGVPECVAREEAGPAIAIVAFMDFECPYCRAENFTVRNLIDQLGDSLGKPVRLVRKHFPLSQHKYARDAAKAAICADDAGRGELMSALLFSAEDLSPPALEAAAGQLGLDAASFRACMGSASTAQRLADDVACGLTANIDGLPTFYVGDQRFEGLQKDDALIAALRRAARLADAAQPRP